MPVGRDRAELVLLPKPIVIVPDCTGEDGIDNPTYNRIVGLTQEWKINQVPSNELIELLLDEYFPAEMRRQLSEKYDEGYENGQESERAEIGTYYEDRIPCQNGVNTAIRSLQEGLDLAEKMLDLAKDEELVDEDDVDKVWDIMNDVKGDIENYQSGME